MLNNRILKWWKQEWGLIKKNDNCEPMRLQQIKASTWAAVTKHSPWINVTSAMWVSCSLFVVGEAVQTTRILAVYFSSSSVICWEFDDYECVHRCSAASGQHLQHSGRGGSLHHSDVLWTGQTEGGDRRSRKLHLLCPEQRGLGGPADCQYNYTPTHRPAAPRTHQIWFNLLQNTVPKQ